MSGYVFCSLVSSFGIASLTGTVFSIASCGVFLIIPGGNSISSPTSAYVWSLIAGFVVFLVFFIALWPRERPGESIHRSPDPEN